MHREGRPGVAYPLFFLLLLLVAAEPARGQVRPVHALVAFDARLADYAREGAMRRLRDPACQLVLSDFADAAGRSLASNLLPFALPADEYLARIPFLDGAGLSLCGAGQSQLLTTQGVARIFVCKPFLQTVRQQRDQAEVYVIHEMLHTLGLGENPPSSQDITQQVKRRCAP